MEVIAAMIKAIEERRTVRKYTDQPVEEEKLREVLASARLAPTWANKQCWKLIVVRDQATREKLAQLSNVEASEHYPNPGAKGLAMAPVVLVACADPARSGHMYGQDYYLVDVGIVMDHILLAATEVGLGTCFVGVFDEQGVKDLLGIPSHIRVVAMTPLGYAERWPNPRPRNDIGEMVFEGSWRQQVS